MIVESKIPQGIPEISPAKVGSYVYPVGLNGDSSPHSIFAFQDPNTKKFLGGSVTFDTNITIEYPDDHLIEYENGSAKTITGKFTEVDGGLCFTDVTFVYTNGIKRTFPTALVFPMVGMKVTQEGQDPFIVQ